MKTSAPPRVARPSLTCGFWLSVVQRSVKLPWNCPLHHHHLISHDWNYWSPSQQPEQISFWLKTEATGWKLESLMVICTHWGTLDVSIPSPVTFTQLSQMAWCITFFFIGENFLSFIGKFVWSIMYDPANKSHAQGWICSFRPTCKQSLTTVQASI